MGIGTSLGAYYEDSLNHHAGNEYLLDPNSTPDNNELNETLLMHNLGKTGDIVEGKPQFEFKIPIPKSFNEPPTLQELGLE